MPDSSLFRYEEVVPTGSVPLILTSEIEPAVTSIAGGHDASAYRSFLDSADLAASEDPKSTDRDGELAVLLHRVLAGCQRRDLTDARFWQWLTTVPCREYVINRWAPECKDDPHQAGRFSIHQRFCGGGSITGTARNALARLFWVAEGTVADGDYGLTKQAFENSDLLVGVFERRLGLEPRLSRSCIQHLDGVGEEIHRLALRVINFSLSTVLVEALTDDEVDSLVQRSLSTALAVSTGSGRAD